MQNQLCGISDRILDVAEAALAQANNHAVFHDHLIGARDHISVLNAATAGELFLKAIIAKEDPLLIFEKVFRFDNGTVDFKKTIEKGRTCKFGNLPNLLHRATGDCISELNLFENLQDVRNSIQHFIAPNVNFRTLTLEFIYKVIDPLIYKHFGMCAIEYHEDWSIGYDYLVETIIENELLFSIPQDFKIGEIDFKEVLLRTSESYQTELMERIPSDMKSELFNS